MSSEDTVQTLHRDPLTFAEFSEANVARVLAWPRGDDEEWSLADWGNALAGEVGELCNVIKKIRREQTGMKGSQDPDLEVLRSMAADEIADVMAYLDLVAWALGIDTGQATRDKFNRVSRREGFPQLLDG